MYTTAATYGTEQDRMIFGEKSDHLGNVRAVVSDIRKPASTTGSIDTWTWQADITDHFSYYPFGMLEPGRQKRLNTVDAGGYKFSFNGKLRDDSWHSAAGTVYDYGFRIYDARIARFLSVDPLTKSYPWYTPYQFAGNNPIWFIDLDGLEPLRYDYKQRIDLFKDIDDVFVYAPYLCGFHTDQQIDFVDNGKRQRIVEGDPFKPIFVVVKTSTHLGASYSFHKEKRLDYPVNVNFETYDPKINIDDFEIKFHDTEAAKTEIKKVIEVMNSTEDDIVIIPNTGFENYDKYTEEVKNIIQKLALKRAQKIKDELIKGGIAEERIKINQSTSDYSSKPIVNFRFKKSQKKDDE